MTSKYLFSHKYKFTGWIFLIIGLILGVILIINDYDYPNWEMSVYQIFGTDILFKPKTTNWAINNIADEIAALLIIIGGILVAFSKTLDEDEYIAKIRMESLIWATYVNYIILAISVIFIFDMPFFDVMIANMFTILLFFIFRFHFVLYKSKKTISNEK